MILRTVYGIEIRGPDDRHIGMARRLTEVGEAIAVPGNFPVESMPVLRYLPPWFPGGGFKKWADDAKRDISYIVDSLFDHAKATGVSSLR